MCIELNQIFIYFSASCKKLPVHKIKRISKPESFPLLIDAVTKLFTFNVNDRPRDENLINFFENSNKLIEFA